MFKHSVTAAAIGLALLASATVQAESFRPHPPLLVHTWVA